MDRRRWGSFFHIGHGANCRFFPAASRWRISSEILAGGEPLVLGRLRTSSTGEPGKPAPCLDSGTIDGRLTGCLLKNSCPGLFEKKSARAKLGGGFKATSFVSEPRPATLFSRASAANKGPGLTLYVSARELTSPPYWVAQFAGQGGGEYSRRAASAAPAAGEFGP